MSSIHWKGLTPVSKRFDDVYFSIESGFEETQYVFLNANRLAERLNRSFTVGELGFGTGLNFLSTWKLWDDLGRKHPLHYIAVEKYALTPDEIAESLKHWPELHPYLEKFLRVYREPLRGVHRFLFGDLGLTLFCGDVIEMLSQAEVSVDAWFLDGFAPSKNPEMWSTEVFKLMNELSSPEASFSTFTAATQVRKDLEAAGFSVEKIKGFGKKREMLRGGIATPKIVRVKPPWYELPRSTRSISDAIIIGGGLAGTAISNRLAARGVSIQLIEREGALATQASGNPAGLVMPILTAQPVTLSRFSSAAFDFSSRHLQNSLKWKPQGLLKLAHSVEEAEKHSRSVESYGFPERFAKRVTATEASQIAGVSVPMSGVYFPEGGAIDPSAVCKTHADHPLIKTLFHSEAISFVQDSSGRWTVLDKNRLPIASSEILILANAIDCASIPTLSWLPIRKIRGQIYYLETTEKLSKLKVPLTYDGYLTPNLGGYHLLGATYDWQEMTPSLRQSDQDEMINLLKTRFPSLAAEIQNKKLKGRVAFRTATSDKLPIVGPVPEIKSFCEEYKDIYLARPYENYPSPIHEKGLYLSVGFGSYGLTYTLLAAELLASQITNEPLPIEKDLTNDLNPARFIVRRLKRAF